MLPVVEGLVRERRVVEARARLEEAVGWLLAAKADLPSSPVHHLLSSSADARLQVAGTGRAPAAVCVCVSVCVCVCVCVCV